MMYADDRWQDHMQGAWGWFGGAMMILWMVLLLVAIVAVVTWLVRAPRQTVVGQEPTPRQIVDARFARGEIDAEQRETLIAALDGERHA